MSIGFATLSHQSLFLTRPANDADHQYGSIPVRYLAVSRRSKVMTSRDLRIGIGCIGSGVGQSVINSCRLTRLKLHTVGLGTNPLAFGLYACDDYAYTPSIYHVDYLERVLGICEEKNIQLLIPGHDDEAHLFARHIDVIRNSGIEVLVAGCELLDLCRDKRRMSNELNQTAPIFVRSFDRHEFLQAWESRTVELPAIAKPLDGYASRGIFILQSSGDFDRITDSHVIQELAIPRKGDPHRAEYIDQIAKGRNPQVAEVSIQLVARRDGTLIGRMASYNKLSNGIPIEIFPFESQDVWDAIEPLMPRLVSAGLQGPFNLQGRLTDKGLKLFEMNARFTGITGLRAPHGF
jgi:biotin carboxylase